MGELGLMGINVSEKYGGSELDALAYAIAMEEISRGCANAGNIMTAHNSLYIHPISKYGTEAQNFEHVTPFVTGIFCKETTLLGSGSGSGSEWPKDQALLLTMVSF